ncbi:Hypothetical predicted protein [Octopus vulgaris]|uniref:DDE-1 domain-containing protein n=1 Tax=Octopus vulgaris TaxID=6645 RepID=A0AA36FGE6_OCTVU|nr:Hypothetical predicted protein [Octopus vulgaris]
MKRPTIAEVCEWVKKSWGDVRPEIIVKAFKKCGISNALDGTEDDALFEDSDFSSSDEDVPCFEDDEDFSGVEDDEEFSG